jgi:glycyl-tRNA synthetase beta chain
VANQEAPDGGVAIAKGNSKVLSARLADAQFFQSEDAKKKLIKYYDKLDTVVFHKKLGSIKDKAERVAALARELAPYIDADPDAAEQAAKLAKCDLVTNMVIEFTSLQGQIGAQMYRAEQSLVPRLERGSPSLETPAQGGGQSGEVDSIATAIEEHYKPQGPSDTVPTNPVAVAVALADKLDTLVGFWAIDEKPTGSKDPFALRRAALGLVRIILENDIRLDLSQELLKGWAVLEMDNIGDKETGRLADGVISADERTTLQNLAEFILDRLKVYLRDKGIRHDMIDAVFANGEDDLVAIVNRVEALQSFLGTSEGENLLAGYKRAANILKAEAKKGDLPTGDIGTLSQSEAIALQTGLTKAKAEIDAALASESYSTAMTALSELRRPIDAFFDNVMVVAEDNTERENNLRLLGLIRDTARQIADFDKISG